MLKALPDLFSEKTAFRECISNCADSTEPYYCDIIAIGKYIRPIFI